MVDKALDACKQYLDCPHGMVLNHPAFTRYHVEMGEISTYPAGYNNDAWEHYTKICPAWIQDQQLHKVEPYVYCQMVAGKDAAKPGEGKNSWLTGTAAWNWYTITQFILGIKPTFDGLEIDPCIPSTLKEYSVKRTLRGAEFDITVKNPNGKQSGVSRMKRKDWICAGRCRSGWYHVEGHVHCLPAVLHQRLWTDRSRYGHADAHSPYVRCGDRPCHGFSG